MTGEMRIRICTGCKTKVLPTQEGQCPSCQTRLEKTPVSKKAICGTRCSHGAVALIVLGGCMLAAGLLELLRTEEVPAERKLRLIA